MAAKKKKLRARVRRKKPSPPENAAPKTRVVNCKTEPFDVLIDRTTKWGNPYRIGRHGTREEVIEKFRGHLDQHPELVRLGRRDLKGRTLGCHCKPKPCHGDVWAEVLDDPAAEELERLVPRAIQAMAAIRLKVGKARGVSGKIQCPVCHRRRALEYSVAVSNGHIWARCKNGCVAFMQ